MSAFLQPRVSASISRLCHPYPFCPLRVPNPPFSLRGESLGLIVAGGRSNDLITMLVDSTSLCCCQLWLLLGLFLNLRYLLPLLWWCWDLHTQNDVSNFWLCQWCHIHTVETAWITPQHPFPQSIMSQWQECNLVRQGIPDSYPRRSSSGICKEVWHGDALIPIRLTTAQDGSVHVYLSAMLKPAQ